MFPKFVRFCFTAVILLEVPSCYCDEVHSRMVNDTIRNYLRQYKNTIVKAKSETSRELSEIALDLEIMFHEYVQNVSILFDFDNKVIDDCVREEILEFDIFKQRTEDCHLVDASEWNDYKYGKNVNWGNFMRAVLNICADLYDSNTTESYVNKCVSDAGPPFIKLQGATVADVTKDGDKLIHRAQKCANAMKNRYVVLQKNIYKECSGIN